MPLQRDEAVVEAREQRVGAPLLGELDLEQPDLRPLGRATPTPRARPPAAARPRQTPRNGRPASTAPRTSSRSARATDARRRRPRPSARPSPAPRRTRASRAAARPRRARPRSPPPLARAITSENTPGCSQAMCWRTSRRIGQGAWSAPRLVSFCSRNSTISPLARRRSARPRDRRRSRRWAPASRARRPRTDAGRSPGAGSGPACPRGRNRPAGWPSRRPPPGSPPGSSCAR